MYHISGKLRYVRDAKIQVYIKRKMFKSEDEMTSVGEYNFT